MLLKEKRRGNDKSPLQQQQVAAKAKTNTLPLKGVQTLFGKPRKKEKKLDLIWKKYLDSHKSWLAPLSSVLGLSAICMLVGALKLFQVVSLRLRMNIPPTLNFLFIQ